MLKDMADSKRINDHIQGTAAQVSCVCQRIVRADIQSVVHPLVISRMFWPNIGDLTDGIDYSKTTNLRSITSSPTSDYDGSSTLVPWWSSLN
jgi:hypothetical protein